MEDEDFAFALSLQDEFISVDDDHAATKSDRKREHSTSIVDECWETIDPTPDIRQLFLEFNDTYFQGKLAGCEVKWSPRMTLCAGVCCYEGRGGLCSIKLSLPLLKLRPRRDLVQTLLHEMIHALLFVTHNNKDHNAHGPEFHKHMYRINKQSGTKITVYHNFHDEVDVYRQHWWRCSGPCQKRPPYYGMVKRAMNRAPSERDPWWAEHQQKCGGSYTKVKEPEDYGRKKRKLKDETDSSSNKSISKGEQGMPKIYELWKNENTSDVHSGTKDKENNMQKSNVGTAPTVIPFTGKGVVLGTCNSESSTKTKPWLTEIRTAKVDKNDLDLEQGPVIKNRNNNGPSNLNVGFKNEEEKNNKVMVHGKVKKNNNSVNISQLTIVDAFKRVEKKSPIIIIDDSPAKPEVSPSNLVVPCPVCQTDIQKNLINLHLDSCLL